MEKNSEIVVVGFASMGHTLCHLLTLLFPTVLIVLEEEMGLSYIFIAHDLSVVKHISDNIGVMYLGQMVEISNSKQLFKQPKHPYTRALLSALPKPTPGRKVERILLQGDVPTPINPPPGCYFSTRCPEVLAICKEIEPAMKWAAAKHLCKCHLVDDRRQSNSGPPDGGERRKMDLFPKSKPDQIIEI